MVQAQHLFAGGTFSKFDKSKTESNLEMHQEGYKFGFSESRWSASAVVITTIETCLYICIIDVDVDQVL